MSAITAVGHSSRRAALLCGAALLGLTSQAGRSQTLAPVGATETPVVANAGGTIITTPTASSLAVDLKNQNRVVDWTTFNVGSGATVAFQSTVVAAGDTVLAVRVLNRVTTPTVTIGGTTYSNISQIYGQISAGPGIAVWLSNPQGILMGPTGGFSGSSLVLSTSPFTRAGATAAFLSTATTAIAIADMGDAALAAIEGADVVVRGNPTLTGSLIIAAQRVAVTGQITVGGDIALVAARTVTVPADLGSPIQITINEGTTVANARVNVGAGGKLSAQNIVLAGVANTNTLLLGVSDTAMLTTTAIGAGRVILAAGSASTDSPVTVSVDGAAGAATTTVNPDGAITAKSVEIRGNGIVANGTGLSGGAIKASAGAVTVAGAGNVALNNMLSASTKVSVTAGAALALGKAGLTSGLVAGDTVALTAGAGTLTALGTYTVASGVATDTGGVTLSQTGAAGGIDLGGTAITAGTEASAGSGYRGPVAVTALAGPFTVGTVDAASLTGLTAVTGDITAQRISTISDLTLKSNTAAIRLDDARSKGSISLTAATDVSGRASAGATGLLPNFGRTAIGAGTSVTVRANGGVAQLGDIGASGVIDLGAATGVDLLNARTTTGNILVAASAAAGEVRGTLLQTGNGSVTITATGDVRGQTVYTPVAPGVGSGLIAAANNVDVDTKRSARLGIVIAGGAITVGADGSVTGQAIVVPTAGPGLQIAATGSVTIASTAARAARVALDTVTLGAVGGAVNVYAANVSAAAIDTAGAVRLDAAVGVAADRIGTGNAPVASVTLVQTATPVLADVGEVVRSTGDTLSPNFGRAGLSATGALSVTAGRAVTGTGAAGVAQLGGASGSTLGVSGAGVTITTATSTVGATTITATTGGLYLGGGSAATTATLMKQGGVGAVDADEVRIRTPYTAGGALTVTSPGDVRGDTLTSTAGNVTVSASGSVTGIRLMAASTDGRLAANYSRLNVSAGEGATSGTPFARVTATGGVAQLGTVTAGVASLADNTTLDEVSVTGVQTDVATVRAAAGNMYLTATGGRLRLGDGRAKTGVVTVAGGAPTAGIVASGNAEIGTARADTGDVLLRVGGTLSGLTTDGVAPAVAGGLTVGTASGDIDLRSTGTGDVTLGTATVGTANLLGGDNVRIGTLGATGKVTVTATNGSVTGLGSVATAAAGANLYADTGSILLPSPTGGAAPTSAVLGQVVAAQNVTLQAGALSAQTVQAGGTATVSGASGVVIGNLVGGSVPSTVTVTAATATPDSGGLTVNGAGALRPGFGFANISTSSTTQPLSVTAQNGVAQLGAIAAGTGATLTAALAGANAQLAVDARAITVQGVVARNGTLSLLARAGDLYLGTPAGIDAPLATIVSAGDRALIVKQGATGQITVAGQLLSGTVNSAGGTDDGVAMLTSATGIAGRAARSMSGDVRLYAATEVTGLVGSTPGAGTGTPIVAQGGDTVLGSASVTGALTIAGGNLRIGTATSDTSIDLAAGGSVTGLGVGGNGTSGGTGSTYQRLDLTAQRDLRVEGLTTPAVDALDRARLGALVAGGRIDVTANSVSIVSLATPGAVSVTAKTDLYLGSVINAGSLMLSATTATDATATYAVDDAMVQNEAFDPAYDAATLTVTSAGAAGTGTAAGTVRIVAARVAQLGQVTAGATGGAVLLDAAGASRDQIVAQALGVSVGAATARNGSVNLAATGGGLYAGTITAGLGATLGQQGMGAFATGNELRVATLNAGTLGPQPAVGMRLAPNTDAIIASVGAARLGTVTNMSGSILIGQTTAIPEVSGLLRVTADASNGQALPAYGAAVLSATGGADAAQRVAVTATGTAKLGAVEAGNVMGTTLAAGATANPQIAVTAGAMDVDSAIARNGDLALTTTNGRLRLGALPPTVASSAARNVTLIAGSTDDAAAELYSVTAATGALDVQASLGVTGLLADGVAPTIVSGLRIGTVDAQDAVTIAGAGNVRLGTIQSRGPLAVDAGYSVTGLGSESLTAAPAVTLLEATVGNVIVGQVRGRTGAPRLALASVSTIRAGGAATVNADRIAVGSINAATTALTVGRALAVGSITTTGVVNLSTDLLDTIDATEALTGVLAPSYGEATLNARDKGQPIGTVRVTAGRVAQLASVTAGEATDGLLVAAGAIPAQVTVTANAISLSGSLTAVGGGADLLARTGDLRVETGNIGAWARLTKTGTTGLVSVGTLRTGLQATSATVRPTGQLINGGTALIDSSSSIAGVSISSQTGDILLRAVTGVTGRSGVPTIPNELVIGDIGAATATITGGGAVRLGEARTSGNFGVAAAGSITGLGALGDGRGVNLNAARGVDVGGSNSATLGVAALGTVVARQPATLENGQTIAESARVVAGRISAASIDAATGTVRLTAGNALNVGRIVAGALTATTSTGDPDSFVLGVTDTSAGFGEETLAVGFGDARLLATGTLSATAGNVAQLGRSSGSSATIAAQAMTIRSTDQTTGTALTVGAGGAQLTSRAGALYLQSATVIGDATLRLVTSGNVAQQEMRIGTLAARTVDAISASGIRAGTVTATGMRSPGSATADLSLVATLGAISGLFTGTPATPDTRLIQTYGRADLTAATANATIAVLAQSSATPATSTAANIVQLGTVVAGTGTAASRTLNELVVRGGSIDLASGTATNGNAVLEARVGVARAGTLIAGGGIEEAVTGGTYLPGLRALTDVEIGDGTARTGDVQVTVTNGNVSGLSLVSTAPATNGLLPRAGRGNLTAQTAGQRVVARATNGTIQLGNALAGQGAGVTGAPTTVDLLAVAVDTTSATANNGALSIVATGGALTLGGGSATTNTTLQKTGAASKVSIGTGGLVATTGNVLIESTTDFDTAGTVTASTAGRYIRVNATGATPVGLGTTTGAFDLTANEVNLLLSPTVVIDARANALRLGALNLGDGVGSGVLRLLSTGDVTLAATVRGGGAATRVFQIGGATTSPTAIEPALPADGGFVTPGNLARSITATTEGGAVIMWTGQVALAGQRIVFGNAALRGATAGATPDTVARLSTDPNSSVYTGNTGATYLSAGQLTVLYSDFALFQNSGPTSALTAGTQLGSAAAPTALALRLFSSGETPPNSFALFGSVNGLTGSGAALQAENVVQFSGGAPRTVRVNLANSRINGCGIGGATAGCLASAPPPPRLSLFDERQIQLFRTEGNPELQFDPLIGTNNEGLLGDLVGAANGDRRCPSDQQATCPAPHQETTP